MQHKLILGAATAAIFGASALAQPQNEKPKGDKPMRAEQPMTKVGGGLVCHKASSVIGADIKNAQNEDIGDVEDLVIDPKTGRIDYAVVELDKRGPGDQWYAVPFESLSLVQPPAGKESKKLTDPEFTLNLDTAKLDGAPHFAKDKWPDVGAPAWRTEIDTHYGVKRAANGDVIAPVAAVRASKLLDQNVKNKADEKVGDVDDLALDPRNARISYVIVSTGGFLGMGDKQHAIPWEATQRVPVANDKHDMLVVDISKERLAKAPEFKKDEWAHMTDPTWMNELYAYYDSRPYWGSDEMKARDAKPVPAGDDKKKRDQNDPR